MDKSSLAYKFASYLENPCNLIEDCFQTFDASQKGYVPLILFPKQKELLYIYQDSKHVLVNKSRQAGVSTITAAYIAAVVALATKDNPIKVIIVANKALQAQDFLLKVKDFLSQVPRWVWGKYYDDKKVTDGHLVGKGSVKSVKLLNGSVVTAVATSKDAIRGQSSPRFIVIDEAAHIDSADAELMYGSAMMALSSNPDGQMFLISTPMGTDEIFYRTHAETIASNGANKFTIHEMYYFQDPRYNKNLVWKYKHMDGEIEVEEEVEYDNKKMAVKFLKGWMPESDWYKEQCAVLKHDKRLIYQEVLCKFDGSGNNVIDYEHITRHEQKYVCDPIFKEEEGGNLWIWELPIPGDQYCAFADVSKGDGGDYSSLEIINMTTGEQALEYKGQSKPELFAPIVKRWCDNYSSLCDVDTTGGYGDNLLSELFRLDFRLLKKDENGESTGFKFSGVSRPKVIQRFVHYVETDSFKIKSTRLISELKTYVWLNGRPDHMRGFNDDCIIASAGAIWLFETHFKNIKQAQATSIAILNAWANVNAAPLPMKQNEKGEVKSIIDKTQQNQSQRNVRIIQNGVDVSQYGWLLKRKR